MISREGRAPGCIKGQKEMGEGRPRGHQAAGCGQGAGGAQRTLVLTRNVSGGACLPECLGRGGWGPQQEWRLCHRERQWSVGTAVQTLSNPCPEPRGSQPQAPPSATSLLPSQLHAAGTAMMPILQRQEVRLRGETGQLTAIAPTPTPEADQPGLGRPRGYSEAWPLLAAKWADKLLPI